MKEILQQSDQPAANRKTVRRLVLVSIAMFGFGFAMLPLYGVLCDITGLGGRSVQVSTATDEVQHSDREVQLRFLATTNSALPWKFQAIVNTQTVRLGEMSQAMFMAMNPTDEPILAHATYNVVPPEASLYFVKTECFCFTQQLLQAQESREMPVYYYIQADLPEHIREITLSYTFYRNEDTKALSLALASADVQD